jgi:hypothetical protein
MFEPSVNQISSAYLGNPGALQQKVQQEQKASPNLPPDLRDLLALQDIQQQKAAFQRQQAMNQQLPPTVAQQLMQAVQQPVQPTPQGMPQGMQPGMPQGAPQGMPQGMPPMPQGIAQGRPQGMPQAPQGMQRPGIQQLPSNIGQHMAGGGIVAFAEGEDVERDTLRRMEAAYDPAITEALNRGNSMPPAYTMPAELVQRAREIEARALNENPEQAKAAAIREYQNTVGNRDTSQYDRLIAEYENRKKQLEAPKPGMDALLEYLGQVAATPRGRTWMESGAAGARAQNELNAQRQAQQFELTKQGIEAAQKKADILYGEKKDLFGMGRSAYDQAYKINYEAALKMTQNAFEAEKLAKQMTDSQLNRESNEKMAVDRNANALKVAGIQASTHGAPTFSDTQRNALINEWMQANPGKTRLEATTAVATAMQGATPELKRAQLMGGYVKEFNDLSALQKMSYEKQGITTPQQYAEMMTSLIEGKAAPTQLPLPASKNDLVPNQVYQTARGAAKWDGTQFIPVIK